MAIGRIGPYEVVREIGRGGMGAVLEARAPDGRRVAVKVMLRPPKEEDQARFDRERRLQASLGISSGFVPLLDSGLSPQGPYVVMPFCEGGTLRGRMDEKGPLPVHEAFALGRALGEALGHAHAQGIVHRDVKPENVLFTRDGRPLIADLGLAKHYTTDSPGASQSIALSKTGESRGTVGYMAAEQIDNSKGVGPATDVFALAAILYESLAGVPPFHGESRQHAISLVLEGKFASLRSHRADVPKPIAKVIERALARNPDARPADGAAFAQELLEASEAAPPSRRAPLILFAVILISGGAIAAGLGFFQKRAVATNASPPPAPASPRQPAVPQPVAPPAAAWPGCVRPFEKTRTAKLERVLGGYEWRDRGVVYGLAVAPDEKTFVTSTDKGELRVFDLATGAPLALLGTHAQTSTALAISPDGKHVLSGGHEGDVQYYELATGKLLWSVHVSNYWIRSCAFFSNDRAITVHRPDAARLWDVARGQLLAELRVAAGPIEVAASSDGTFALISSDDGTVARVNAEPFELVARVVAHQGYSGFVTLDPTNALALSLGHDQKICLWDAATLAPVGQVEGGSSGICGAKFLSPRTLALSRGDRTLRLWDVNAASELGHFSVGDGVATTLRPFAKNTRLLAGSPEGFLRVLDVVGMKVERGASGHAGTVRAVAFSPDGKKLVTGGNDDTARIWDAATGAEEHVLRGHKGDVTAVAWLPGNRVATASADKTVRVWSAKGSSERVLEHDEEVATVVALDGNRVLSAGDAGIVREWDLITGTASELEDRHQLGITTLVTTPDAKLVVSAGKDHVVNTWDPATRLRTAIHVGHRGAVNAAAVSRDHRLVSVGIDGTLRFWDGDRHVELRSTDLKVMGNAVAVSPDGKRAFVACGDQTLRVFEVPTGLEVDAISLAPAWDQPSWVAVSPDGKRLAVATESGAVLIFGLTP